MQRERRNPYETGGEALGGQLYDPRSRGLDGEVLDHLHRAAFTDGANIASRDLRAEFSQERPRIWQEGYVGGIEDGTAEGARVLAREIGKKVEALCDDAEAATDAGSLTKARMLSMVSDLQGNLAMLAANLDEAARP